MPSNSRKIPELWSGQECWILGGGPSLLDQFGVPTEVVERMKSRSRNRINLSGYFSAIHGKNVIGVNNAYQLGNWVDIAFFGERHWFKKHEAALTDHPAWKVTCCPHLTDEPVVTYVAKDSRRKRGIEADPDRVVWNLNSGAAAISLAWQLGAKRIILVGFDMNLDQEYNSHWHGRHYEMGGRAKEKDPEEYARAKHANFERHLRSFRPIQTDAERLGLTIINASPDSEIEDLPKASVAELLAGETEDVS